ncbi:MAG: hypothetical protein HN478_04040, partial [Rhodospirillaceae bacterium]|nr:hypothetical protein [Rhodospirillaceae bacterium]
MVGRGSYTCRWKTAILASRGCGSLRPMSDKTPSEEFELKIREAAEAMIARHGPEVENETTEKMIEVLDTGSIEDVLYWLKVRQRVRQTIGRDRYIRRLPDKIIWAIEQAIEQGRSQLARLLGGIYSESKAEDDKIR